jgi:hypothetical protein
LSDDQELDFFLLPKRECSRSTPVYIEAVSVEFYRLIHPFYFLLFCNKINRRTFIGTCLVLVFNFILYSRRAIMRTHVSSKLNFKFPFATKACLYSESWCSVSFTTLNLRYVHRTVTLNLIIFADLTSTNSPTSIFKSVNLIVVYFIYSNKQWYTVIIIQYFVIYNYIIKFSILANSCIGTGYIKNLAMVIQPVLNLCDAKYFKNRC